MAMFCVAIRRDSVSFLKFPLLSYVQFSCEISFACRLKYPYNCFSFHFCFLVIVVLLIMVLFVLFLVAVVSLFLLFFMLSLGRRIVVSTLFSMLVSPLSSFFDAYSLSMSFNKCKALCIIISFLVLWSICWSSSLVHFKNGPEDHTRRTAQVFIPLMRFLPYSLASCSFPVLLGYSFKILSFLPACLMVSASNIPEYLSVFFSPSVLIFLDLVILFLPSFSASHYQHGTFSYAKFHPYIHVLYSYWVYYGFEFFLFLANSLISSMDIWWLILFCNSLSLNTPCAFLGMWMSGTITITNNNGDSATSWNIPLWIFISTKLFHPVVNSTRKVFVVSSMNLTSSDILYILNSLLFSFAEQYRLPFCCQSTLQLHFLSRFAFFEDVLINV